MFWFSRPCEEGDYDEELTKIILEKSMKDVGCITPFLPLDKTIGLPVCDNKTDGLKVFLHFTLLWTINPVDQLTYLFHMN